MTSSHPKTDSELKTLENSAELVPPKGNESSSGHPFSGASVMLVVSNEWLYTNSPTPNQPKQKVVTIP